MRIPFLKKGFNTGDEVVAAFSRESELDKKVLYSRAKRMERVRSYLDNASDEDRNSFLRHFTILQRTFSNYAVIATRLNLYIDNNVLQDILQLDDPKRKAAPRVHALLAFLALAQDYYFVHVTAFLTPTVLYEASHRGAHPTKETVDSIVALLANVGLYSRGTFGGDRNVSKLFRLIRHDEKNIAKALSEIKARDWNLTYKIDPSEDGLGGVRIPFAMADEMCPNVELRYFQPWTLKYVLMHIIHLQMKSRSADKSAEAMMKSIANDRDLSFLKLTRKDKSEIEGLADIELFTNCMLRAQEAHQSTTINMGISFDEMLMKSLFQQLGIARGVSVDGDRDSDEGRTRVAYLLWHSQREGDMLNKRAQLLEEALGSFLSEMLHGLTKV